MEQRGRLSIAIVIGALLAGGGGDWLLRAFPWGINVSLWTSGLLGIALLLVRWFGVPLSGDGWFLRGPIIVFALLLAWRDSTTLALLNTLTLLTLLGLAIVYSPSGRLRAGGVLMYAGGVLQAGLAATIGPFYVLFVEVPWQILKPRGRGRISLAIIRGLVIALPLVLVFGGLFAAADPVFAASISNLANWNLEGVLEHGFIIGFWTWIVLGALGQLLLKQPWATVAGPRPALLRLGLIEVSIILGVLNLLFAAFVLIQIRYLFGGEIQLNLSSDLTYAEYARKGFFELVTVAALLLPTLLLAHWLLQPTGGRSLRIFQGLAGGLLVLLVVVMISALQRMRLYQQEYGLTELRLYTSACMGWLALVFGWFAATVLRNRGQPFMTGAFGVGITVLLNSLNPDALIVRTNAGRAQVRSFDSAYAISLSADAVPAVLAAMPTMKPEQQCGIAARLLRQWDRAAEPDWRTWNWSRAQARASVAANRAYLESVACFEDR